MSDVWFPWDPHGTTPPGRAGEPPVTDPEPIVRRVRIAFLLAGLAVAVLVSSVVHPLAQAADRPQPASHVAQLVAVGTLAVLVAAWFALRPAHLVELGRRAVIGVRPLEHQPRLERARAIGFTGLATGWAVQAIAFGFLPVVEGVALEALHGKGGELLSFVLLGLVSGAAFQAQVVAAVRLAVEDPALRSFYGARGR